MNISLEKIAKSFGSSQVIHELSLEFAPGKLTTLLGPSGCGKTTLLRIIAGLAYPDRGRVLFGGHDTKHWSFRQRNVGFVFQHFALFDHMTVVENIRFGLRMVPRRLRKSTKEQKEKVEGLLALVQLEGYGARYPAQLSGGQKQRVALARALAIEPKLLLMDEPLSALDPVVRKDLRKWLRSLQDRLQMTSILVTHDQEEAIELSDTIVLMDRGRIRQIGTPQEIVETPSSPFVLTFLNSAQPLLSLSDFEKKRLGLPLSGTCYVKPHEIAIFKEQSLPGALTARVNAIKVRGKVARLTLGGDRQPQGVTLEAEVSIEQLSELGLSFGELVSWSVLRFHHYEEISDYSI